MGKAQEGKASMSHNVLENNLDVLVGMFSGSKKSKHYDGDEKPRGDEKPAHFGAQSVSV